MIMIIIILETLKKVLVKEFLDVDSDRLENMMGVVDDLQISFLIQDSQNVKILNNDLRENFFSLVKNHAIKYNINGSCYQICYIQLSEWGDK